MDKSGTKNPDRAGNSTGATTPALQKHPVSSISPTDILLDRLDRVKQTGPGTWLASCPTAAHRNGDRSRGLSIREGDDGRVLLHCFAGCPAIEVVAAVGLELHHLFPPKSDTHNSDRPRVQRIPLRDLLDGIRADLWICSLAFSDLSHGKPFTPTDAETIAHHAAHLAGTLAEVRYV